jgi:hypothetical protein
MWLGRHVRGVFDRAEGSSTDFQESAEPKLEEFRLVCWEIYICSSRLGAITMDHRHSGNGKNSRQ